MTGLSLEDGVLSGLGTVRRLEAGLPSEEADRRPGRVLQGSATRRTTSPTKGSHDRERREHPLSASLSSRELLTLPAAAASEEAEAGTERSRTVVSQVEPAGQTTVDGRGAETRIMANAGRARSSSGGRARLELGPARLPTAQRRLVDRACLNLACLLRREQACHRGQSHRHCCPERGVQRPTTVDPTCGPHPTKPGRRPAGLDQARPTNTPLPTGHPPIRRATLSANLHQAPSSGPARQARDDRPVSPSTPSSLPASWEAPVISPRHPHVFCRMVSRNVLSGCRVSLSSGRVRLRRRRPLRSLNRRWLRSTMSGRLRRRTVLSLRPPRMDTLNPAVALLPAGLVMGQWREQRRRRLLSARTRTWT